MSQDVEVGSFGLARIKEEGAPVHPDDITVPMHLYQTERYKRWYQCQLDAYNKHQEAKNNEDTGNS